MSRLWRRPGRGWSSSRGSLSWPRWNDDGDDGGDGDDSDVDGAGAGKTDMRKIFDIVFHRVFSHPSEPNRGQRWRPYLLASMQGGGTLYSINCLYLRSVLSIIFPIKATACFCWGKWENAIFLPSWLYFCFCLCHIFSFYLQTGWQAGCLAKKWSCKANPWQDWTGLL